MYRPRQGSDTDRRLFVDVPVTELARSLAFYPALGLSFDDRCTAATAACTVVSDHADGHRWEPFRMKPTHRGAGR